jgi:cytochrome c-type biogenesis protein CcmH
VSGWIAMLLLAGAAFAALWRFGRLDGAGLQLLASALLLALAGYAWQGSPGLAGRAKPAVASEPPPADLFAEMRRDRLGRFDTADRWLTIAEMYQSRGDSRNAAGVIRSGLREHPRNAILWVGYGNALVLHAGGLMTPAAQLAYQRAAELAPGHPAPPFFYGLSLAQGGRLDEAERIWSNLLAAAPPEAGWRGEIERQLLALRQARAMGR